MASISSCSRRAAREASMRSSHPTLSVLVALAAATPRWNAIAQARSPMECDSNSVSARHPDGRAGCVVEGCVGARVLHGQGQRAEGGGGKRCRIQGNPPLRFRAFICNMSRMQLCESSQSEEDPVEERAGPDPTVVPRAPMPGTTRAPMLVVMSGS